ncbi:hypothetical protein [Arenibacter lacus]|uniref:hypothetical protein n=1 Tax=Arenibacter lacus TaxID=2608629 RepID=UPI00123C96C6|nr:hypothetical protein [Arenibacter lacus]
MRKTTVIAVTFLLALFNTINAQVGIGTPIPSDASMLDIVATDKGVLIPRVKLTSTIIFEPITGDKVESILVYNTESSSVDSANPVKPGFYYWQGNEWQRIVTQDELDEAIANLGDTFNISFDRLHDLINYIVPTNPSNEDDNGNPIVVDDHSTVVWDETTNSFYVVAYDATAQTYVKNLINLNALLAGIETNTFIRVNANAGAPDTYHFFSEAAIKAWLSVEANVGKDPVTDMPIGPDVVTINVVGDVVANFEYVLNQKITYEGEELTIEQVIQNISSEVDGNVIYKEINPGEWVFQYYNASTNQYETISLSELVQNSESNTFIKKVEAVIAADGTVTSPTVYYYFSETAIKDWLAADITNINPEINMPNTADGVVAITVTADDVAANFEQVLNKSITFEGEQLTVEQVIQKISSVAGNVIYTEVDGEMVFQYHNGTEYVTINLDQIVQSLESNTFIRKVEAVVEPDGTVTSPSVYYYFSEEAIKNWLAAGTGNTIENMPNNAQGVVAITLADDVANDFDHILNQTITYKNNQLTIEEVIQTISSETDGNVIYVNDKDSTDPNAGDEWVFKYYDTTTSQYVTINLGDLVTNNETKTKISRAVISTDGEAPTYEDSTTESSPTAAGQILYKYEAEGGNINYLNLTEDMLHSIENNESIKNAITNILNEGGNVLFGDVTIGGTNYTGVLHYYDENGDAQLIDVSKTLIQNLIDNSTQVQELKNVLGNKYVENTLIYTGDTIDGKVVAAYKTTTTIGSHTAVTGGISLPQAPSGVVSISLYQNGNLITNLTTDHVISGNNVDFNIGVGNHYQVLPEGSYEVIIEFTVVQ